MKKEALKTYSLDEITDKLIGKLGTPEREEFENELRLDLLGEASKIKKKMKQNSELKSLDQFIDEKYEEKGTPKRDKLEKAIFALTEEQRNETIDSKKEIEQGLYTKHELLDKEVSTWLSTK